MCPTVGLKKKKKGVSVSHCHRSYLRLGGSVAKKCHCAIATVIPARAQQTSFDMTCWDKHLSCQSCKRRWGSKQSLLVFSYILGNLCITTLLKYFSLSTWSLGVIFFTVITLTASRATDHLSSLDRRSCGNMTKWQQSFPGLLQA